MMIISKILSGLLYSVSVWKMAVSSFLMEPSEMESGDEVEVTALPNTKSRALDAVREREQTVQV